jgi:hypothetical protein
MVVADYKQNYYDEHVTDLNVRLKAKWDALIESLEVNFGSTAEFDVPAGHISLDKIAGASRYIEAIGGRVEGWGCLQSWAPMVGGSRCREEPLADLFCQSFGRENPRGRGEACLNLI